MYKKATLFIGVLFFSVLIFSCTTVPSPVDDPTMPGVIVTRGDGLSGTVKVTIDGKFTHNLKADGKWGLQQRDGRHSIKAQYKGQYTRSIDYWIDNDRVNFRIDAFENTEPTILKW